MIAKTKFEKYFLRFVFMLIVICAPIKIYSDMIQRGIMYEVKEYQKMFKELWRS